MINYNILVEWIRGSERWLTYHFPKMYGGGEGAVVREPHERLKHFGAELCVMRGTLSPLPTFLPMFLPHHFTFTLEIKIDWIKVYSCFKSCSRVRHVLLSLLFPYFMLPESFWELPHRPTCRTCRGALVAWRRSRLQMTAKLLCFWKISMTQICS